MRESIAAFALIRRVRDGRTEWLVQWNRNWQRFHFVGGHKRPDESFRECAVREIGEELHLGEHSDFTVSAQPAAHLEYTASSAGAGAETRYTVELFDVELREHAVPRIEADPANRWIAEDEIRTQRCHDGRPVSPTMGLILKKAGLGAPPRT